MRVNYSTFSSNEDMYAKLASGSVSYDVVVPSDYMIQRLIAEGLVQKLDHENIPNLANLHGDFYGENAKFDYYDKGCLYSVPYMYGMVGIIYNTTMVDPTTPTSAAGSCSGRAQRRQYPAVQQLARCLSVPRSTCWDWTSIRTARQTGGRRWRSSRSRSALCRAMSWMRSTTRWRTAPPPLPPTTPGDFMTMYEENEDPEFYYPSEGTNLYVDAMCIPTSAKNKLIAERYIDFMLTEEPAVANAEYTYYGSPNRLVRENEEYIEYMNSIKDGGFDLMYDTDNVPGDRLRESHPRKAGALNQLWEELKSDIDISTGIYVICGVIIAVMAGFGVCFAVRRKIRNIY